MLVVGVHNKLIFVHSVANPMGCAGLPVSRTFRVLD